MDCVICHRPTHDGLELLVVKKWGEKDPRLPQWMGKPAAEVAHYVCDREARGVRPCAPRTKPDVPPASPASPASPAPATARTSRKESTKAPTGKLLPSDHIHLLRQNNPRKPGTHGWKSWNLVKEGMTVSQYLAAGGRKNDLSWDINHGWAKLKP
jgi:hypothetical protein